MRLSISIATPTRRWHGYWKTASASPPSRGPAASSAGPRTRPGGPGRRHRAGARHFAEAAGRRRIPRQRRRAARRRARLDGWDTHINEGAVKGASRRCSRRLDGALAAIEKGMGPAWSETVVVLVTEFGRTARVNGTEGTDHGTATVALLPAARSGRPGWPIGRGSRKPISTRRDSRRPPTCAPCSRACSGPSARGRGRAGGGHFPGSAAVKPIRAGGVARAATSAEGTE